MLRFTRSYHKPDVLRGRAGVCVRAVLTDSILNAYPTLHHHTIQNLSQRHGQSMGGGEVNSPDLEENYG